MPRDRDYWARKEHFEKYGYWPKSDNKSKAQFEKHTPEREQSPEEKWEKANPELAAYDNDGNPIQKED